ncbi:hypothetical protein LCGC14_1104270 [marine sediment metagenome]|uniref:Histidine kinase/HSP90-like ATPase domain-containing protein n=1 Tax=marine sediment metagenome TaxID=412755 RepID=A0A0F9M8Q4_9ZZZZ
MARAQITVAPRLLKLVGRAQYTGHPLTICVRELLQNSRDACVRKGVEPEIYIAIHRVDDKTLIICRDNGIGMTADQIENDFLQLGGVGKTENSEVGGFGIAKAAIMSGEFWQIRSLNNTCNIHDVEAGNVIRKTPFLDGTEVRIMITESIYYGSIHDTTSIIYASDVKLHFKYTWEGKIIFDEPTAGFPKALESFDVHTGDTFDIRTTMQPIDLPDIKGLEKHKVISGVNIIRVGGLAQFIQGHNNSRETTLIIDLKPKVRPDHELYPLTMNRESFSGIIGKAVDAIIQAHNTNVMESVMIASGKSEEKNVLKIVRGKFVSGKRKGQTVGYATNTEDSFMGNSGYETSDNDNEEQELYGNGIAMIVEEYSADRNTRNQHAKILALWQEILELTVGNDEKFGIGITGKRWYDALRWIHNGDIYYVINPDMLKNTNGKGGLVLRLWTLAAHEATHALNSAHNENFSSLMDCVCSESADAIYESMTRLKRLV